MNIERALRLRDHAEQQIADLWSRAEHFGTPHTQMLDERAGILEMVAKTPSWVRDYLSGVWSTHTKYAYRQSLVYGAFVDGRFLSTHNNRSDYYERNGVSPCAFAPNGEAVDKGHYWIMPDGRAKPFFISID